ncbi:Mediator of RNA polymerase II transcription subunit 4 [Lecanosticta acicola]|uniref:Mediator of RNA polymerase II transcription subunit 4 n=1 Tax=Lecanosticta acicola TaxID=111012 RepID=A0AAI8Z9B0_9PEZI|nr:Mediator of RNA polymerase II transcription subunit 4 [Lecanosticta acicola]
MYSQFQTSYQRVDASLQRLTDSIAAYNPSTTAAEELVAADEAVNKDVEQLVEHQQNHLRILQLRRTAVSLDEQIKNTLRLLADVRKEILSIPAVDTDGSDARREVKVDELLSYAKFISKTTVPPTFRKPLELPTHSAEAPTRQIANGIATPPQGTSQQEDGSKEGTRAVKELADTDKAWLLPQNLPFDPWPNGEVMRMGALGRIQKMLEDGEDPASVLSEEERKDEERKRREQEEREERETRKAREEWGYGGGAKRGTVADEPFNPDDF